MCALGCRHTHRGRDWGARGGLGDRHRRVSAYAVEGIGNRRRCGEPRARGGNRARHRPRWGCVLPRTVGVRVGAIDRRCRGGSDRGPKCRPRRPGAIPQALIVLDRGPCVVDGVVGQRRHGCAGTGGTGGNKGRVARRFQGRRRRCRRGMHLHLHRHTRSIRIGGMRRKQRRRIGGVNRGPVRDRWCSQHRGTRGVGFAVIGVGNVWVGIRFTRGELLPPIGISFTRTNR